MLIIPIKEEYNGQIDKVLKNYKRKVEKTRVLKQMKKRKFFIKKSVLMREQKQHAVYVQQMKQKGLFE